MLENSVWKQYNAENSFREKLAQFCNIESLNFTPLTRVGYRKE